MKAKCADKSRRNIRINYTELVIRLHRGGEKMGVNSIDRGYTIIRVLNNRIWLKSADSDQKVLINI